MFNLLSLSALAIAAQAVLASPIKARTEYAVKERHNVPHRWVDTGRAPAEHNLHLKIGLKQCKFDELERQLLEVSTPSHPKYGQHLSMEEVHELVKPADETLDLVHEWLLLNGVDSLDYSPAKDWINIYVSVDLAERLLDTEYSVFQHEDGTQLVRTSQWSLPAHLHDHIDTIQPTTSFMRIKGQKSDSILHLGKPVAPPNYKPPSNETISKVCDFDLATLECFNTLYGTLGYKQKATNLNSIGFNNYLNQTPVRPDLEVFLETYNPAASKEAFEFKSVSIANGPPALDRPLTAAELEGILDGSNEFVIEANLDSQTILGMTFPIPVTSFSTGGSPPFTPDLATPTDTNEPYLTWATFVSSFKDLPLIISSSYGDDEQTVPQSYAQRVCQEFAQIGARGTTLLVSSGDSGLGDETGEDCVTNDGKNTPAFLPAFPAGCPFVTTVGATFQFEPELPANLLPQDVGFFFASGSGFSNYFPRPSYQNGVVDKYVKALPKGLFAGLYNPNGRGYPDVAAQGNNFALALNQSLLLGGFPLTVGGTSASCPLMSSILSLANDALLASGKPPLGFLNPWLYGNGQKAFTDIVGGTPASCGTSGFPVGEGWDPSTGFGTPFFPEILKILNVKG